MRRQVLDEVLRRNLAALRKSACTHTDGGMLWCVPPTSASLTPKVERSKSEQAHQAPETPPLLRACIFSRNILSPFPASFWLYAATANSPTRVRRNERIYFLLMGKSTLSRADRLHYSLPSARLLRDAKNRRNLQLRELSKVPRRGPAEKNSAARRGAARRTQLDASAEVRSDAQM